MRNLSYALDNGTTVKTMSEIPAGVGYSVVLTEVPEKEPLITEKQRAARKSVK